jgi:glycosyltransferase involved in cell wall biosynthesis
MEMGDEKELVSVIIPTHNRAATIARAIESVLGQRHVALPQLVVVDDASSDNTAAVVANYPEVELIRMAHNVGASEARNVGLQRVTGTLVAFLDSDDAWHPEKLARQIEAMPAAGGLVMCGYRTLFGGYRVRSCIPLMSIDPLDAMLYDRHLGLTTSTFVVSADLFRRGLTFDPSLSALDDLDFAIQAARLSSVSVVPEILVDKYAQDVRFFGSATSADGRRSLIEKYGSELASRPVAKRRQYRRLAAAYLRDGRDIPESDLRACGSRFHPQIWILRGAKGRGAFCRRWVSRLVVGLDHLTVARVASRLSDVITSTNGRLRPPQIVPSDAPGCGPVSEAE